MAKIRWKMIPYGSRKHNEYEIAGSSICNSSTRSKVRQQVANEYYYYQMECELLKEPEYEDK